VKTKGVMEKKIRKVLIYIYKNNYINLPASEEGMILCGVHYRQVLNIIYLHCIDKFYVSLIN
jgi:hypothetical protein